MISAGCTRNRSSDSYHFSISQSVSQSPVCVSQWQVVLCDDLINLMFLLKGSNMLQGFTHYSWIWWHAKSVVMNTRTFNLSFKNHWSEGLLVWLYMAQQLLSSQDWISWFCLCCFVSAFRVTNAFKPLKVVKECLTTIFCMLLYVSCIYVSLVQTLFHCAIGVKLITVCEISTGPTPLACQFPIGPVNRNLHWPDWHVEILWTLCCVKHLGQ